jgi:hypothetical protein
MSDFYFGVSCLLSNSSYGQLYLADDQANNLYSRVVLWYEYVNTE